MNKSDDARIAAERNFHNERFGEEHDFRGHLNKWYSAIEKGKRAQDNIVKLLSADKIVLEYGCSDGDLSLGILGLPAIAKEVHGIDISDKAIEKANARAVAANLKPLFRVMNAESLEYENDSFDLVYGRGIIHHLDLATSLNEIKRVLKVGGKAVFLEPMGHNVALNWYRNKTPSLRTHDEHPIIVDDFVLAKSIFGNISTKFYGLTTLIAVPFQKYRIGVFLMGLFEKIDSLLLSVPIIKKNAWFVLIVVRK